LVKDIDPIVERVILRCIEKDPAKRPASALQVAAALPGGDPLAAALAAGETPSPEMVAASGETEGLRPVVAWVVLAGVIVSFVAAILLGAQSMLYRRVPLEKPPEALAERAREILRSTGYSEPPVDTAMGFYEGKEFLRYIAEHDNSKARWDNLETGAFVFWYRGSPRPLAAYSGVFFSDAPTLGSVWTNDPPMNISGMTLIELTPLGHLRHFIAVPPQIEEFASPAPSPDWTPLFSAAGLDASKWSPAQPAWTSPVDSDTRAAWTGTIAEHPEMPMRIEAAAYLGKPVYFELIGPWTRAEGMQPYHATTLEQAGLVIFIVLVLSLLVVGALLARRNLRLGRGDRRGASRLAAFVFAAWTVAWFFGDHHVLAFDEFGLFGEFLVYGIGWSCLMWVLYIALEPYVRRRWPAMLISWSRLLAGGFRDPLVGRDVLAGCLLAPFTLALGRLEWFISSWLGYPPPQPGSGPQWLFLGARAIVANQALALMLAPIFWIALLFVLFLFRVLLRKEWAAAAAWALLFAFLAPLGDTPVAVAGALIFSSLAVFVMIRFGLLALVTNFVVFNILQSFPLTTQGSAWYAGISLTGILLMAAITFYAFYTSLGSHPIFGGAVLEE
jgi:serine/threonine-protein kinase